MDNELINKAFLFASEKHKGQIYNNGEFIQHPLQTYEILKAVLPKDTNLLAAGLLHDTIEDTDTTKKEIEKEFNEDIASLVWEVTKYKPDKNKAALFPNLKTKRGIILKFADRLSNLTHMEEWPDKKQQWYLKSSKFWLS